jgi:hypothetical protein
LSPVRAVATNQTYIKSGGSLRHRSQRDRLAPVNGNVDRGRAAGRPPPHQSPRPMAALIDRTGNPGGSWRTCAGCWSLSDASMLPEVAAAVLAVASRRGRLRDRLPWPPFPAGGVDRLAGGGEFFVAGRGRAGPCERRSWARAATSRRAHFVERERKPLGATAASPCDMPAQLANESFRADYVRFGNSVGAVMQVLMRSDIPAAEAFFRDHLRVSGPEILASFHAPGSAMLVGNSCVDGPRLARDL